MRALSANLFAVLLMCALASVFYVWSALENRLERHKRGFSVPDGGSFHQGPSEDLSAKTFRALLAVPVAQRQDLEGRSKVQNLTNPSAFVGSRNYHVNGDDEKSTQREGPVKLDSPVDDGILWSDWLEDLLPDKFTEGYAEAWRNKARTSPVVKLEPGCGRISNQLATFADGTKACVRYGINADQVQGETLTYYLASLLGITNLPPLVLSQLSVDSAQWVAVKTRINNLQWSDRAVVSLTEWISNLTGVVTPAPLRQDSNGLHPASRCFENKTTAELLELIQWSDLIVFDYLTANFDRLVSNLFSLQWDPHVMERDTNNLLKYHRSSPRACGRSSSHRACGGSSSCGGIPGASGGSDSCRGVSGACGESGSSRGVPGACGRSGYHKSSPRACGRSSSLRTWPCRGHARASRARGISGACGGSGSHGGVPGPSGRSSSHRGIPGSCGKSSSLRTGPCRGHARASRARSVPGACGGSGSHGAVPGDFGRSGSHRGILGSCGKSSSHRGVPGACGRSSFHRGVPGACGGSSSRGGIPGASGGSDSCRGVSGGCGRSSSHRGIPGGCGKSSSSRGVPGACGRSGYHRGSPKACGRSNSLRTGPCRGHARACSKGGSGAFDRNC